MKISPLIYILLITLLCVSVISVVEGQQATSEQNKKLVNEFKELAIKNNGIIPMTMTSIKKYLSVKDRPYDFIALFSSSDPKHGCAVCDSSKSEFLSYSQSYLGYLESQDFEKRPIFLGIVEVSSCMEFFTQLNIQTIPHLIYFPAGTQPLSSKNRVDQVDKQKISDFIKKNIGVKIDVVIPVQERVLYGFYLLGGIVIGYRLLKFIWSRRKNPIMYFIGTMILFSLVIGGIFYDFIHRPPLMEYNYQSKQYTYFSRGPRTQTISEGLIMGSIVVITSLIYIFITKLPETSLSQSKMTSFGLIAIFLFCFLLACLNRGYQMKYYKSWFDYPMLMSGQ